LLYTTWTGQPSIFKVTDTKQVSAFAPTFPTALAPNEKDIDVNPGFGPWFNKYRFVYVTQSPDIFEITPDGCTVKPFIKMETDEGEWLCITFDRVGTFDFDMIVISLRGKVWRVNSAGMPTQIADLKDQIGGADAGGAAVVPKTLGPNGGELWVATHNGVWSIKSSDGTRTQIANIPNAENVAVIPAALTELGSSGGSYFTADWPTRIVEYPASDFIGHAGNVLVGKEDNGSLMEISYTGGTTYQTTEFQQNATKTRAEAAAFVQTLPHLLVYTVKFVCGCFKPKEREEGPVEPGSYTTAINIHNPNYCNVTFVKKAVLLFDASKKGHEGFEIPKPPNAPKIARLEPDWGMEIDCADIREVLLTQPTGAPGPKAPTFIKGWVVIQSPEPLDVVAVYTARGLDRDSGVSIETERVLPTRSP
jgi:hypothetical protein